MSHSVPEHNPFMLLLHPEAVLAAVEKSERLGRLNRHLCRPLDRLTPASVTPEPAAEIEGESEDEDLALAANPPQ